MKKIILGFLVCLFLFNIVLATQTEIKIKTLPNHEVQLTIFKSNVADFITIQSFKENSDEYGDVTFKSNINDPEYNIIIFIKKDNEKVSANDFENPYKKLNMISGENVYLEIAPSWFTFIDTPTNETDTTQETIENLSLESNITNDIETTNDTSQLTGFSISNDKTFFNKTFLYGLLVIGLLIGSFVMFIVVKKTKVKRKIKGIEKLDKTLDNMDSKDKKPKRKKDLMEDVKKKMKQIEEDLDELKD